MVKKCILVLLLVSFVLVGSGFCWVSSFRSAASGNLLFGDLDNDLDPIYIWDNQNYRLYTTLSNLSSSNDEYFSNSSDGVYLFGISGNFGVPRIGNWESRSLFLIQLADTRSNAGTGLDTDFNGVADVFGDGEMSGNYAEFTDVDNDNVYDFRRIVATTADNFDVLKRRDWHLTHGLMNGNTRVGVSISHLGYGNNSTENNRHSNLFSFVTPDHPYSFSKDLVDTDLSTTLVTERRLESGDFNSTLETPANIINFSYQRPCMLIASSDLRIDLTYNKSTSEFKIRDNYNYSRDISVLPDLDIVSNAESIEVDSTLNGYLISPSVQLTKHWSGSNYSWFALEFGMGTFDADKAVLDHYTFERRLTDGNGDLTVGAADYNESTDRTGETKRREFRLYHKTVVDFSPKFTFAIGLDYMRQTDDTDWDEMYDLNYNGSFTISDGVDDANDTSFVTTASFDTKFANKITTKITNLPVSMEYKMGRWTFRIGAVHTILNRKIEEDTQISDAHAQLTIISYGDGTADTTLSDLDHLSVGEKPESKQHFNNFVYGLEFRPNENLRIELLEFLGDGFDEFIDTEYYRQLRLSMTILF